MFASFKIPAEPKDPDAENHSTLNNSPNLIKTLEREYAEQKKYFLELKENLAKKKSEINDKREEAEALEKKLREKKGDNLKLKAEIEESKREIGRKKKEVEDVEKVRERQRMHENLVSSVSKYKEFLKDSLCEKCKRELKDCYLIKCNHLHKYCSKCLNSPPTYCDKCRTYFPRAQINNNYIILTYNNI